MMVKKRSVIIFMLFAALCLVGCSKENAKENENEKEKENATVNPFLGTWETKELNVTILEDSKVIIGIPYFGVEEELRYTIKDDKILILGDTKFIASEWGGLLMGDTLAFASNEGGEYYLKKRAEKAAPPKKAKLPKKRNSEADFIVQLTEDSTGCIVTGYKGESSGMYIPATIQGLPVKKVDIKNKEMPAHVTSVVISDGCEYVYLGATADSNGKNAANNVTNISLPDSIEHMKLGWTQLYELEIPANVTVVGEFDNAQNLEHLEYLVEKKYNNSTGSTDTLEKVSFRGAPKVIGEESFSLCEKLSNVVIPEGVEVISTRAFAGCTRLEKVTLPSSLKFIANDAFTKCSNLKEVIIPKSVTSITFADNVFANCSSLSLATQARLKELGYTGNF